MLMNHSEYLDLVQNIKQEIRHAQYKATLSVNKELIGLYYNIGQLINVHKTWGSKFIENLAADIKLSFPEAKGYSVRNLKYMAKFAATYTDEQFVQTVSAQIPWSHNVAILDKVKTAEQREWYIPQPYRGIRFPITYYLFPFPSYLKNGSPGGESRFG